MASPMLPRPLVEPHFARRPTPAAEPAGASSRPHSYRSAGHDPWQPEMAKRWHSLALKVKFGGHGEMLEAEGGGNGERWDGEARRRMGELQLYWWPPPLWSYQWQLARPYLLVGSPTGEVLRLSHQYKYLISFDLPFPVPSGPNLLLQIHVLVRLWCKSRRP